MSGGAPEGKGRGAGGSRDRAGKAFVVRRRFDGGELVGARWWNESFEAFVGPSRFDRRALLGALPSGTGKVLVAGGGVAALLALKRCGSDDDVVVSRDALELQREQGWDVGHADRAIIMVDASDRDVDGGTAWTGRLPSLAANLAPVEPRLRPYAVPTLFQALSFGSNRRLRDAIRPVHATAMDAAFARARALDDLASRPEAPPNVAVIVDLPGPESVAVAAALADRFAPVFTFDNWPHPLGVVRSHQTLGACLYYLPLFERANATRPQPAPPLFVLDADRLAPYRDETWQFDNRYLAPLPSAAGLRGLGASRVLYVRPSGSTLTELDDLNADFVAFERDGVDVRAVALDEFQGAPAASAASAPGGTTYVYGGHPHHHAHFWSFYRWGPAPVRFSHAPAPTPPPAAAARYRPAPRPTIFSGRVVGGAGGVGRQKPSGFGRVSVRTGGGSTVFGSRGSRRSGSYTRWRSSFSG